MADDGSGDAGDTTENGDDAATERGRETGRRGARRELLRESISSCEQFGC